MKSKLCLIAQFLYKHTFIFQLHSLRWRTYPFKILVGKIHISVSKESLVINARRLLDSFTATKAAFIWNGINYSCCWVVIHFVGCVFRKMSVLKSLQFWEAHCPLYNRHLEMSNTYSTLWFWFKTIFFLINYSFSLIIFTINYKTHGLTGF